MATLHPYLGVTKQEGHKKRVANNYNSIAYRRYGLHISKKKEKDIIKWLEDNKPYQTAIKKLIKEQIKKEKAKK